MGILAYYCARKIDVNDTLAALLFTFLGGLITQIVGSILKRGENRTAEEIEKDKLEFEQAKQMRDELRQEVKELRDRLIESDKARNELARKVAQLEAENIKKDIRIVMLEAEIAHLQKELDKFNRKVYYVRKEDGKDDTR